MKLGYLIDRSMHYVMLRKSSGWSILRSKYTNV